MYHYIPEKRDALARWIERLTAVLGYAPNEIMKAERKGFQGKGAARRLGYSESYAERKARLATQGRDLDAERRLARAARKAQLASTSRRRPEGGD
jgi:hypothetical protein